MDVILLVITSLLHFGKSRLEGFYRFIYHHEPVGAFGWFSIQSVPFGESEGLSSATFPRSR